MTENNIEKRIADAIEASTPDILAELMSELDIKDEPAVTLRDALIEESSGSAEAAEWKPVKAKRHAGVRRAVMGFAAALVVLVGGLAVFRGMSNDAFAVVGLDVNPSIELAIDKNEKVISAEAINEEGELILDGMNLKGSDVNIACNAIIGSMLTQGYLNDSSNSVLVSVRSGDAERGREIEKEISDNLNTYLGDSEVAAAILGQLVYDDDELEDFAEANGISVGKAWLIRNLLDTGSARMTEADLLQLSTQELILLGQKRNVPSDVSYGDAESGQYIGSGKAMAAALAEAGLDESQVSGLRYEFDCENGAIVYEIEFVSGGMEYEYEIDAVTGRIISSMSSAP